LGKEGQRNIIFANESAEKERPKWQKTSEEDGYGKTLYEKIELYVLKSIVFPIDYL
jgi:hypothetical protein